jgi:hypothetical protein
MARKNTTKADKYSGETPNHLLRINKTR